MRVSRGAGYAWLLVLCGTGLLACESCDDRYRDPGEQGGSGGSIAGSGGAAGEGDDLLPPSTIDAADDEGDVTLTMDGGVMVFDAGELIPEDGGPDVQVDWPLWTTLDYLQCYCNDASTHEMCLDYDVTDVFWQDMFCGEICATHLGLSAIGAAERDPLFCDAPKLRASDLPDLLVCRCADGHEASLCADLSCFDELQRENACNPTCAQHGGTVETECEDYDYDTCIPPGPTLIICGCNNGEEVHYCSSYDCQQGTAAGENCRNACTDKGGGAFYNCRMDDVSCL